MAVRYGKGREKEVKEVIMYKRAAAVGRLLLGELNEPLENIEAEYYRKLNRRELKTERENLRSYLRTEVHKFCNKNFEKLKPEDLADLFNTLEKNKSHIRLPLIEFEQKYGKFKEGVLKGAPFHATVCISPWGLQTEFPELHFSQDLNVSLIEALHTEKQIKEYRGASYNKVKEQEIRGKIAKMQGYNKLYKRACILSCFNLVECHVNGLAWDFTKINDISILSKRKQEILVDRRKNISLIKKLIQIPRIISGEGKSPLNKDRDPLKTFIEYIKPFRDAIVHSSPFSKPEEFGGYNKLDLLYNLDFEIVMKCVASAVEVISRIYKFVGGKGELPEWMPFGYRKGTIELDYPY